MKKNIESNNIENVIPVNKSLGNINGERTLFLSGTNVQGITSDADIRAYDEEIKVKRQQLTNLLKKTTSMLATLQSMSKGRKWTSWKVQ